MKIRAAMFLPLFCFVQSAWPAEPAPAGGGGCACCAEKAMPRDGASSREKTAGAFSRESLYQAEAGFTDDAGRAVALGSLRGHPVVVDLFFTSCGYACPLTVTDLLAIQARLPAELRRQTIFLLVSFDVDHDTPAVLARYRAQRGLDAQWLLWHGSDDAVRELAALLGVKYKQEADGGFSHSNLLTVLNAEGEIVHQRVGLKGGLDETVAALTAVGAK